MYFFYFDESGSRDPDVGGNGRRPKDYLYILLAVGIWEGHWRKLDRAVALVKLELADDLRRRGLGQFDLADCEVKSNWLRKRGESQFLDSLLNDDRTRLANTFYDQLVPCHATLFAVVVDKRQLHEHMTHETLHKKAYELILERIEQFMVEFHPKHNALIVMDDTNVELNRAVAMKHAFFQRAGNQNLKFHHIVEYPFFTRSELSNGIQLADLCAYNVYRTFKDRNFSYPYFSRMIPHIYKRQAGLVLDGLKVWPEGTELITFARTSWVTYRQQNSPPEVMAGA